MHKPALLALLALALVYTSSCSTIRGLDPVLADRYQPTADGQFRCLDGKKSVPYASLSDDYCDCLDGSDEPGTSACPNGHFYCRNKGFVPLLLNSSMVDDGICDCCDGSDEPAGRCQDTCQQQGWEALSSLRHEATVAEKGVAARQKFIDEASGAKAQWARRKGEVDAQVATLQKDKEGAEAQRSKLEEEERKLKDRKRELEEQQRKAAAEASGSEQQQEGVEEAAAAAAEGEAAEGGDAGAAAAAGAEGEEHQQQDGEAGEAAAEVAEKSEEELAKERMAQWIPGARDGDGGGGGDDAAAAAAAAALNEEEGEEAQFFREPQQEAVDGDDDAAAGSAGDGGNGSDGADAAGAGEEEGGAARGDEADDAELAAPEATQPATALGKAKKLLTTMFGALTGAGRKHLEGADGDALAASIAALESQLAELNERLAPVRTRATEARTTLHDLEKEAKELGDKVEGSYGEGDAFVSMADRCFETTVDKYTYEICPYRSATQKEGHSSTSLGTWTGLEEGETVLVFQNGQNCWQGPNRSMTVRLKCGLKEVLSKVEEPSRCEYTAQLQTPAACTPALAQALRLQLAEQQRLVEGGGEEATPRDEL